MRLLIHRVAFKALLALFYLIVLGAQLSHKFYYCANAPIRAFKYQHAQSTEQFRPAGSALSNVKSYFPLSLDKRYEFKGKFAIPAHQICLQSVDLVYSPAPCLKVPYPISPSFIIRLLRGPPSI
jgi:hypothetical protein